MANPSALFSSERAAHPLCLGREPLVQELDRLLFDEAQHWVVLSGAPGRGKSALVSAYLGHLTEGDAKKGGLLSRLFGGKKATAPQRHVVYHFLSKRLPRTTQPDDVAASLADQLEAQFPAQRDASEAGLEPILRLDGLLDRVSQKVLGPAGQRLIVVLDGLDEAEGTGPDDLQNPLRRILPEVLPHGVSVLCTTRPREPHLPWLLLRQPHHLDLDGPHFAGQNAAAVHAAWKQFGASLLPPLANSLIQELAAAAEGNLLHAAMAQAFLSSLPVERRHSATVPAGLPALVQRILNHLAEQSGADALLSGLAVLCAVQEPLPAARLRPLLGDAADAVLTAARPLLFPPSPQVAPSSETKLGLHDAVRQVLAIELGPASAALHARLVATLCPWPLPKDVASDGDAAYYALRYGLWHRLSSDDESAAGKLARDSVFLTAQARSVGAVAMCSELHRAATAASSAALRHDLLDLHRTMLRERAWLEKQPEAMPSLLYNRLLCLGWSRERLARDITWQSGPPRLRLRFLLQQDGSACERTVTGREGAANPSGLNACALLDGGQRLLVGGEDGAVEVWLLQPGAERVLWSRPGHGGAVHALLVRRTVDGEQAITSGADGIIKLWDLSRGDELASLRGHAGAVHCLTLLQSSSGEPESWLAAGGSDGTLSLFDLQTRRLVRTLPVEGGAVLSCVAPRPGQLLTGSEDGVVRTWNLAEHGVSKAQRSHLRGVSALLPLADGERLVTASLDGTLKLWRLGQDEPLSTLRGHEEGVSGCVLLPASTDGVERLVSSSLDGTLRLWRLADGAPLGILEGHSGWVTACVPLSPSEKGRVGDDTPDLISVSLDGTFKLWSLAQAERLYARHGHQGFVTALALSPDGQRLVSSSRDKTLKVWDLSTGRHLTTLAGHTASVDECAVLPDNQRVASASHDATLKIWDLSTGQALTTLHGHSSWVSSCAPLPDGERVVSAALDGTLRVWNTRTGQALRSLTGHTDSITACTVLPDGERVVSASADGTLRVWKLQSGDQLATLHGHSASVDRCAVLPGGEHVISASADGTLKLWELATGTLTRTFDKHSAWISACAVLPDGNRVLSAAGDETLKIWDLASGTVSAELKGHHAAIYNCAALDDGRHVVSASGDGTLKLWDAASGRCVETIYASEGAGFFAVLARGSWIFAGDMIGNVWMLELAPSS